WTWVLVGLAISIAIFDLLAFFLAGSNRWSAGLTGAAALIAAVALLNNERANQLAVAPLLLIEWHAAPYGKQSSIIFRNEGLGVVVLQDIRLTVEVQDDDRAEIERAVHSWAQLIVQPRELVHTLLEMDTNARRIREGMVEGECGIGVTRGGRTVAAIEI